MPASSPCVLLEQLDLVAVLLGPARVHAQQHLRPSPGSRCRRRRHGLRDRCRCVGLAGQQRLDLAPRDFLLAGPSSALLGLGDDAGVVLGLAELDQARHCRRARARPCRCRTARPRARCARASASAPSGGSFQRSGSSASCSARPGAPSTVPSQRCLLSSPTDCLISSTRRSISARMVVVSAVRTWLRRGCKRPMPPKRNRPSASARRSRAVRASTARRCPGRMIVGRRPAMIGAPARRPSASATPIAAVIVRRRGARLEGFEDRAALARAGAHAALGVDADQLDAGRHAERRSPACPPAPAS